MILADDAYEDLLTGDDQPWVEAAYQRRAE